MVTAWAASGVASGSKEAPTKARTWMRVEAVIDSRIDVEELKGI
jgi:hypothetical protein